ncbi:MAG: GDP-mannose 4,6-dehydratase [Chloroflexota bacterium]|jgi:nucleoside-diphosphate-sugar epimerase|nr:GDP-mannose 4,6-dehydratase [Chloroflexota bacterium]
MANYLLTGAAGFIGSRVAEFLLEDGHIVYGVDNMNHAYDIRLKEYRLGKLEGRKNFHFRKWDISEKLIIDDLKDWLPDRVAGVINLAAWAGTRRSLKDPWIYIDTNIAGTLNMLELCRQADINKTVLASTSSVYGHVSEPPYTEEDDTDHPLQPYAATKKGAEAMAHAYHHLYDIDTTVLRYFTVYGPAGRPQMVMFRFCKWIAEEQPVVVNGNGEQTRGFTYLDDIARGTILALRPLGFEIVNLGGHEVITINKMIGMLESRIGKRAMVTNHAFHPADVHANHADISKAQAVLGWEPKINLEEGITRLVDWYMQERDWASQIETP